MGQGSWSTVNVQTDNSRSPVITCLSSHLTSFAVLVDVAGSTTVSNTVSTLVLILLYNQTINPVEAKGLSVLTYIGLSVSIVCLIITVIFFLCFG